MDDQGIGDFITIIIVATAIWVWVDSAKQMSGISFEDRNRITKWYEARSPFLWFIYCVFLWIVAFPVYLISRSKYAEFKSVAHTKVTSMNYRASQSEQSMRFRVSGVDRESSMDTVDYFEAISPENAKVKAELAGMIVTRVERT